MPSCIEPLEINAEEYERALVVDGLFTDSEEISSEVTLTYSFGFDEEEPTLVSGAIVRIEAQSGEATILEEVSEGVYQTDPSIFRGESGKSYRLLIETDEGTNYESSWELLQASPPIEDLSFEFITSSGDPDGPVLGAQVKLDTRDIENNAQFFSWDYIETYEYELPHPPRIKVEFGSQPGRGNDEIIEISNEDFEGFRCWKSESSSELIIRSTENLTESVIDDLELTLIDNTTPKLFIRYSILVNQYAISKDYYDNLKKIFEINQTTGSLFDPIPNEIFGNVNNVADEDEPVLGYFGVAGVAQKRLFINREDVPMNFGASRGPSCELVTIPLNFRTLFDNVERNSLELMDFQRDLLFETPIGYILTMPICASCAVGDATNERPDFW